MKLIVEKSSWSGRSIGYEPKVEIKEYDDLNALLHNEQVFEESFEQFSFTIIELGEDYIKIETNSPMSAGDDGTINLHAKETIFKVEKGKKLKLTTLTMDFGFIYTFELK